MKPALLVSISLSLLAIGCSVPKYQLTEPVYRQAVVKGELTEALASYEAQAREAEQNAQASLFPQQYWQATADVYQLAGRTAWAAGQLQKAITYGEKSLEIAEKSKNPRSLFPAINTLVLTYNRVRNFDRARELIEKGVAVVKKLPPNTDPRAFWEGNLYWHLGSDLVRRREYEKAIDVLSLSVYLQQNYLATVWRNPVWLNVHRGNLLERLTS